VYKQKVEKKRVYAFKRVQAGECESMGGGGGRLMRSNDQPKNNYFPTDVRERGENGKESHKR